MNPGVKVTFPVAEALDLERTSAEMSANQISGTSPDGLSRLRLVVYSSLLEIHLSLPILLDHF